MALNNLYNNSFSKKIEKIFVLNVFLSLFYSISKEIRLFRPFKPILDFMLIIVLIVAFFNILYNFYIFRFKNKYFNILLLFSITLFASSLINSSYLVSDIKETAISSYCILGILPLINKIDIENKDRLLFKFTKYLVIFINLFTFLSIFLYLLNGKMVLSYLGHSINIGSLTNRMFGLYESITVPYTTINMFLGMYIYKNTSNTQKLWDRIIVFSSFILGFIYMALSFSYGIIVSFACSVFIILFFISRKKGVGIFTSILAGIFTSYTFIVTINTLRIISLKQLEFSLNFNKYFYSVIFNLIILLLNLIFWFMIIRNSKKILSLFEVSRYWRVKVLKIYGVILLVFISMLLAGEFVAELPVKSLEQDIDDEVLDNASEEEIEEIIGTSKQQYGGFLTGRDIIWRYGLDKSRHNFIIGYGPKAFVGEHVLGNQSLQHMHNVYIQSVVSGGFIHAISLLLIVIVIAYKNIKFLFSNYSDPSYTRNLLIFSGIVFFAINGLIETSFLYVNRFPQYSCWFIVGLSSIKLFESKHLFKTKKSAE